MSEWNCEIKNWTDITPESARLFFSQSEKMLESTNSVNQQLMSKSHKVIVLLVPIISATLGYLISQINARNFFSAESGSGIVFLLFLCFSLWNAMTVWTPKNEYFLGSSPKIIMSPSFITNALKPELQTVQILISECHSYQKRIDSNLEHNLKFSDKLTTSIKWLIASPFFAFITYLLIIFLSYVRPCHFS